MDVHVQLLADGPITTMDASALERRDSVIDNDHEHTEIVEYFLPGDYARAVHRSVHVTLKQGLNIFPEQGQVGG